MTLDFPFELKAVSDKGTFEGLASVYGVKDHGGDIVVPGAFDRTLKERGRERPLLWSHDTHEPVGLGVLEDSETGLLVKGTLDLDVTAGKEAYSRLKKKIVKGLSIGYKTILDEVQDGIRRLLDVDLFEVSLVLFPMNEEARIVRVKSSIQTIRDFENFLHAAGFSKREATALAAHGFRGLAIAEEPDPEETALLEWLRAANANN